jgi:hypothetical protein
MRTSALPRVVCSGGELVEGRNAQKDGGISACLSRLQLVDLLLGCSETDVEALHLAKPTFAFCFRDPKSARAFGPAPVSWPGLTPGTPPTPEDSQV